MTKKEIEPFIRIITKSNQMVVITFSNGECWKGYLNVNPIGGEYPSNDNYWNFVHFNKNADLKVEEIFNGADVLSIEITNKV